MLEACWILCRRYLAWRKNYCHESWRNTWMLAILNSYRWCYFTCILQSHPSLFWEVERLCSTLVNNW